jgi:uncharacterized protein (TIGR02147 family)
MGNIHNYLDYQEYLRDYYQARKEKDAFFSYRLFGSKISVDAGFLVKILQGKLHLPVSSIAPVAQYLKLDAKESEYFDLLVRYGRAKSEREIRLLFEKIIGLQAGKCRLIQSGQYEFYQKWYYAAIHALLLIHEFSDDYTALARRLNPAITAAQAREAIALLSRLDLIRKDKDGTWKPTSKLLSTGEKWAASAIAKYQEETIELGRTSLQRDPKSHRDISTVTIAVSHKDLADIKARVAEFRRGLLSMETENEPADCVYQVNIQVIPLTRIEDDQV